MTIDNETVRRIAELAHLEIDDVEGFRRQFQSILDYVGMLDELDVGSVSPTATTCEDRGDLRDDELRRSSDTDDVLRSAPESGDGHFLVPPVIQE